MPSVTVTNIIVRTAIGLRFQLFDETTERDSAGQLETARQIGNPVNISQDLVTGRAQRKARVRARGFHKRIHGTGDGSTIPLPVQLGVESAYELGDVFGP